MKTLLLMALVATVPITPTPVATSPLTTALSAIEAVIQEQEQVIQQQAAASQANIPSLGEAQVMDVTFYHSKSQWGARTASGAVAYEGVIAADKSYPFGTIFYIPELCFIKEDGLFVVLDRGSAIKGNIIDVFLSETAGFSSVSRRALTYGRMRSITAYKVLTEQ